MRGVDTKDAAEPRQRTRDVQLVSGPGDVAVAEIFQIVVNARRHGHPAAARGHYLVVLGGPELAHVQAVVGEAPVDGHQELQGSLPQQPPQQPRHGSPLSPVSGSVLDAVQSREAAVGKAE